MVLVELIYGLPVVYQIVVQSKAVHILEAGSEPDVPNLVLA